MRYGAMNFPVKKIHKEIEQFDALGFDFLELTLDPPETHYSIVRDRKDAISKQLKTCNMGLVCHLPTFVYTADLTERIRRASLTEMVESLQTAKELGAEKIVVHPGYIGGMGAFVMETSRRYAIESLATISQKADDIGVMLCLENMFPRYLSFVEPEDFEPVFDQFPMLKLTLDTGHANIGDTRGDRVIRFLKKFSHQLGHIHMSDNKGKRDDHLPVGKGNVPFEQIVKALKAIGYDETITLEIFSEDRKDLVESRDKVEALFRK
jgi:sugar phosphate isomerase/epimerase